MTRSEAKKIISATIEKVNAVTADIRKMMVDETEMLVTSDMTESDIERLTRVAVARQIDPFNLAKRDRGEDARALIGDILKSGRQGSREYALAPVKKFLDDNKKSDSDTKIGKADATGHEKALASLKAAHKEPRRFVKGE